ncbi:single-stranded DNA-binding protein [Salinicoccus sp. Marseille-QA3877]
MINRVVLVGRLTRDPEMRVSQSNVAVTNFNLAVNRPFSNKDGEQQADFINIVTFRKTAENVNQYLSKGSLCGIDGRIQTRNYENKEGQRVYVTEVVADSVQFLEPKGSNNNQSSGTPSSNSSQRYGPTPGGESRGRAAQTQSKPVEENPFQGDTQVNVDDDDLPF